MATNKGPSPNDSQVGGRPDKDPDDWTTGDEPMTGPQASYLHTLAQEARGDEGGDGVDIPTTLTKAEASKLIDDLQQRTGRGRDEPPTR
jgi:hypothetical protein